MRLAWPDDLRNLRDWHKNPKSSSSSDDCVILDGDPDKEPGHQLQVQLRNDAFVDDDDDDELVVVAEKGQIACRDYPHARHLCVTFPFNTSPHEKYCDLCHCYVCDILAPCSYWGTGKSSDDHCHSTDKEDIWRELRKHSKEVKLAQLPVLSLLETTLSNEPLGHQTLDCSQPLTTNEERVVELDLVSLALDQAVVQNDRFTGIVKWFDSQKGYGFITHEDGGEDLFVHHSSIKSKGQQSLTEGERVEFAVDVDDHGRGKATNVSGPGGSFVQGASGRDSGATDFRARGGRIPGDRTFIGRAGFPSRRGEYGTNRVAGASSRGGSILQGIANNDNNGNSNTDVLCYKCLERGHLARNCDGRGGGNDNTVRMRVARGGGGREDSGSRVGVSHRGEDYGRNRTAGLSSPGESLLQETTTDNDSSRDSDTLKCYNCGEFGHSIRNCDGGGGGSNNRVRVDGGGGSGSAYRRGEIGRNRAAGLTSRDRSLFQGITGGRYGNLPREKQCYTCGELGHLMRDCVVRSDPFGSSNSSNNHRRGGFVGDTNSGWSSESSNNGYNERNNTVSQRNSSGNLPRGNTRGGSHSGERGNSVRDHHSTERSGGGCFICGKTGHSARDCSKERGSGRNDASVRDHHSTERSGGGCFICGKTGHQARDCSKERGSGRNDGGVSSSSRGEDGWHLLKLPIKLDRRGRVEVPCLTCLEHGHLPMDCPKKHQIWRELHYGL